ncbi:hypothetical protein ACI1US_00299 [Leucobacter sp. BZR 635]
MENDHTAADYPAAQAVHEPAELTQLGIDETRAQAPTPLSPKAKLTAWALGIGGLLALCTLIVGAVTILELASPYLRYLYFLWIGSGSSDVAAL